MDQRRKEPYLSQILDSGSWLVFLFFPLKSGRFPVLSSLLYGEESLD